MARIPAIRFARALGLLLLGLASIQAKEARASSINVNPVRVYLSARESSALVTLKNNAEKTRRFQLSASAWDQSPDGEMEITPTDDVIFFPVFLVVEPGEAGKVRVGTKVPFGKTEKTYRIFLEEMPPLETEVEPGVVSVRTRIGIPVFLQASKKEVSGELSARMNAGKLVFEVRNTGNTHFVPRNLQVRGLGADGTVVFNRPFDGWYLLAGGKRIYETEVSPAECRKIVALEAVGRIGEETLNKKAQTDRKSCGR